jgi:hypothetical protein
MKTLKSLAELYEHVVLNEANKAEGAISDKTNLSKPTEDEVGDLKADQEFFSEVPKPVEGAEKAKGVKELSHKVDAGSSSKPTAKSDGFKGSAPAHEPKTDGAEEVEEENDVFPKKMKEKHEESFTMSAFETLLKKTLAEELEREETAGRDMEETSGTEGDEVTAEMDDTSDDVDETEEDEGDLLSDLKELQDKLAAILSKLEGGAEENESEGMEGDEEYTEEDFDDEFEEEGDEEGPFEESVKAKSLSPSKGKKLMKKTNKVGRLKSSGGKARTEVTKESPLKPLGDKKTHLQKGFEAKSSVKKGEFFK